MTPEKKAEKAAKLAAEAERLAEEAALAAQAPPKPSRAEVRMQQMSTLRYWREVLVVFVLGMIALGMLASIGVALAGLVVAL